MKKFIILFSIGFLLGPLCDLFHVLSHTSGYPYPKILGLAWWVPFLFGSAGCVVGYSHVQFDRIFHRPKREFSNQKIIFGLLSFMMIYAVSGFYTDEGMLKFLILALMALVSWIIFDKTFLGLVLAVATAFLGCLVEIFLISIGHFYYVHPDIWGIPYWLPFLYIVASVSVGNLGRKLL